MLNKIQLQLKDRGGFLVTADERQYHGRFNMKALESFMKYKTVPGIFVLGEMFKLGMLPGDYARFILCGVQVIMGETVELTEGEVMEWIDAMGGLNSNDFLKLMAQGMKTFTSLSGRGLELTDEEKKILGIPTVLNSSDTSA